MTDKQDQVMTAVLRAEEQHAYLQANVKVYPQTDNNPNISLKGLTI